jgi:transcriptional regulator with GAF, ATPase, and Fis domain
MNIELDNSTVATAGHACGPSEGENCGTSEQAVLSVPKLKPTLERLERELVIEALEQSRGNQTRAARLLGITDRIMGLRIRKYGLDPWRFRET